MINIVGQYAQLHILLFPISSLDIQECPRIGHFFFENIPQT